MIQTEEVITRTTQIVAGGSPAAEPREPKKEGYVFEGWYYTDEDGGQKRWDFADPVNSSMTLKARWKKIPEAASGEEKDSTASQDRTGSENHDKDKWKYGEVKGNKETDKNRGAGYSKDRRGRETDLAPWLYSRQLYLWVEKEKSRFIINIVEKGQSSF